MAIRKAKSVNTPMRTMLTCVTDTPESQTLETSVAATQVVLVPKAKSGASLGKDCMAGMEYRNYAQMPAPKLDEYIRDRVPECTRLHKLFHGRVRELLAALVEMERRYAKRPGARTDLGDLKEQTWYGYLQSVGVNPNTFRSWKHRSAAVSQLNEMVDPKPIANPTWQRSASSTGNAHNGRLGLDEKTSNIFIKAAAKLADDVVNPLLTKADCIREAEAFKETLATGNSVDATDTITTFTIELTEAEIEFLRYLATENQKSKGVKVLCDQYREKTGTVDVCMTSMVYLFERIGLIRDPYGDFEICADPAAWNLVDEQYSEPKPMDTSLPEPRCSSFEQWKKEATSDLCLKRVQKDKAA